MKSEKTREGEMESGCEDEIRKGRLREGEMESGCEVEIRKGRLREGEMEGEMESGCEIEIRKGRFEIPGRPQAQGRSFTLIRPKRKRQLQKELQKEGNLQQQEEGNLQQQEEGKLVDVRLIHESVGRDLKCNSCEHHVPRSLKHSILCRKYSPHGPPVTRPYRCFTSCPNCFVEWELWPNNRYADSFDVLSGATYQEIIPEHNPNSNLGGEGQI